MPESPAAMVCEYHQGCTEPVVAKIGLPSERAIWTCRRGFDEWQGRERERAQAAATPDWHEAFAAEVVGKTIAAVEYVAKDSYWLFTFTDDNELSVRLMADEAWHGRA